MSKLKKYTAEEIKTILEKHALWLENKEGGERANLRNADLCNADLRNANLCNADLCNADLRNADLRYANLRNANLCYANLCNANLRNADLCYANLDYSFGFACKTFDQKIDIRIAAQIAYHFCRMQCEEEEVKKAQESVKELANLFHRVDECGRIE